MNRTLLLVVAILAVSGISLAEAARGPTSTERSRILAAIKLDFDQLDQKTKSITGRIKLGYGRIRVSTVDRHWALAPIRIWSIDGQEAQPGVAVLRKSYLTGRWLVLDITTAPRECYVPKAVRKDLGLLC
jgi:hypothetical protein